MKKALFVLSLVILSSFVIAGTKYHMDLSEGSATVKVNERDIIEFNYLIREYEDSTTAEDDGILKFSFVETTQRIMVDKVKPGSVDLTSFLDGSEVPYYVTLNKVTVLNLDLERDGITDVKVKLISVDNKTVTLKFEDLVGGGNLVGGLGDIKEDVVPEDNVEEDVVILEEDGDVEDVIKEPLESPKFIQKLADNWEITLIVVLIILILIWNKRGIKRFMRRNF